MSASAYTNTHFGARDTAFAVRAGILRLSPPSVPRLSPEFDLGLLEGRATSAASPIIGALLQHRVDN